MDLLQLTQTDAREVARSEVEALGTHNKLSPQLGAAALWQDV